MSMQIVFEQILIIFGYVIVGYVAGKKNLITKEQQRYLSKLVSSLILPFTVLSASLRTVCIGNGLDEHIRI